MGSRQTNWPVTLCAWLAGLGGGAVVALTVRGETWGSVTSSGGALIAGGRLAGMVGTYLMLLGLLLVARLPWLERSLGQDRLVAWHRFTGPYGLFLIGGHAILLTLGYAAQAKTGVLAQTWTLLTRYDWMLAAFIALILLIAAGVTSYRKARARMSYETWWIVHLYTYLGLGLAFGHQVVNGQMFLVYPLLRLVWTGIWLATAGVVLVFRVGLPIYRSLRHQLRVVTVREEAPGVVSIVMKGRDIDSLPVRGGQFMQWRFLTRELWWHAHPFSLSAMPVAPYLRITVKALGDTSSALMHLAPGTRVAMEGPYGAMTRERRAPATPVTLANRTQAFAEPGVLLVGGGVGITPIRALIEDLPQGTDVVVMLRARTIADLPHRAEMHALVTRHGGRTIESIGNRHQHPINGRTLLAQVPDVATRDVYLCGPQAMTDALIEALTSLGVPPERIHHESFTF